MKKLTPFLLIILFSIPAILALFHKGFFLSDDGNWMVIRFSAFYEVIRSGQIPVRFLPRLNFGYGYPVADFLYPLFMYLGIPIKIIGFSFVNTIKILFGISIILSGIGSFLWLRKLFSEKAAGVGAIIFMLFPYHIFDLYQRGSVGEIVGLAILPFILYFTERRLFIFVGLGIGLLILAHNVLAILFLPVIIVYMAIRKTPLKQILSTTVLGLIISAFFWIPALYDKQFTVFTRIKISDITSYFLNLQSYGLVGLIFFVVILLSLYRLFKPYKHKILFIFFFIITLLSVFFALSISNFLWKILPLGTYVQFPFRFLSITMLGVAFLSAYVTDSYKKKIQVLISGLFLLIALFSSMSFSFPTIFQQYPDSFYSTNQDTTTVKNEYMPIWIQRVSATESKEKVEIISGKGTITNFTQKGNKVSFDLVTNQESLVQINIAYFPGWKVLINGKNTAILYKENGLLRFTVEKGNHIIQAKFTETPVRLVSDSISLIAMLLFIFVIARSKVTKQSQRSPRPSGSR